MEKDFDAWNVQKKELNAKIQQKFFYEREVWWCLLGLNIGREQDGKGIKFLRPVLILRKLNKDTCWIIPISTKIKTGSFYYYLNMNDGLERIVTISQLRMIDSKRLFHRIALIPRDNFLNIKKKTMQLFYA